MSIETRAHDSTSPELVADCDAVIRHLVSRQPLDPEVYRRVRERSERATEEIRRTRGTRDLAVELIRETRDE